MSRGGPTQILVATNLNHTLSQWVNPASPTVSQQCHPTLMNPFSPYILAVIVVCLPLYFTTVPFLELCPLDAVTQNICTSMALFTAERAF